MSTVRFNGKDYSNIKSVILTGDGDGDGIQLYLINSYDATKMIRTKSKNIRIECTGNVANAQLNNCATVYGNIKHASVGNSVRVDGHVIEYKCPRGTIKIDKTIYICHGTESLKREELGAYNKTYAKARVIKIDASDGLASLSVTAVNVRCEPVIFGNVNNLNVSNCLSVKGNIQDCQAGNMISMTAGVSKARSTRQLIKARKEQNKEIKESLNNIFLDLSGSMNLWDNIGIMKD